MTHLALFGRGLQLSEAQEDQIFSILHAGEPAVRNGRKAARRAREGLDELVRSETYDAARARELAEAQAKAVSDVALVRAEVMYRVRQVLTPEQRAMLDRRDHGPRSATREQLERRPEKGAR
jgi:Spy/CpxP family protein refolding chaperone